MHDGSGIGSLATTIFNPALLSKDALVRGFIARQDILERFLNDLRHTDGKSPVQHQLLIGQRGQGKTSLLRRIAFAVEDDAVLSKAWIPLVFPEEQYNVKNLGDFWLNCADALGDALERMGERREAELLDEKVASISVDAQTRSEEALACLVDETRQVGRGLLLLVDNIDIVLDRLNGQEEWEFRRILSEKTCLCIIGASSRALEAVYEHGRAFYDYFHITDLKGLSDEETFTLLNHIAQQAGDIQVQQHLKEKPERIRALRLLTGGNPRTLMILYRNLAQETEGDVQGEIEQLLDTYTPLYKARFEELAPQAQKLVDAMAIHWDPITAGDLTEKLLPMNVNQVSAQLSRLESLGVIEKVSWFGEKKGAFQVSERFFNVWYLMRASRRLRRRLIWLVKFLEAWFEREEIDKQAQRHLERSPKSVGNERYAEMAFALSQTVRDRRLRWSLESAGLRAALEIDIREQIDFSELPAELQDRKERMERLLSLRRKTLGLRLTGVDSKQLWEVLGGAPHLLLEEKARIVERLPELESAETGTLYAKLALAKRHLERIHTNDLSAVQRLYDALAIAELTDVYDIEGLIAISNRDPERLKRLPGIALQSRFRKAFNPEEFSEAELESADRGVTLLIKEPGFEGEGWAAKGGLLNARLGRVDLAEQAFRRAVELDPQNTALWHAFGNFLGDQSGRQKDAEDAYQRAIEIDPNFMYPWNGLGNILRDLPDRSNEAEEAYRRAIELGPLSALPWLNFGLMLSNNPDRYDEAEDAFRHAMEIDPHFSDSWIGLGDLLSKQSGRLEEAEQAFRHAMELNPSNANPWLSLGILFRDLPSKVEEAEQAFRRAMEIDPRSFDASNLLGNFLHYTSQNFEEAETAYRRAIELDEKSADPQIGLGNLLLDHLGNLDGAEQAYRQAIELDANSAYPWNGIGDLLWRQSKYGEAEDAFRRSIELDPKSFYPWHSLGRIIERDRHRYPEAEQAYRKAIECDPKSPFPWGNLASLFKKQEDREAEALSCYFRAAALDSSASWRCSEVLRMVKSLHDQALIATALKELGEMAQFFPENEIKFVTAGLRIRGGSWAEAAVLLTELASDENAWPGYWTFQVAVEAGRVDEALQLLEKSGADQRWRPLYEALQAVKAGTPLYLRRVAAEIRTVAEEIFEEIAPGLAEKSGDSFVKER